MDEKSTKVVIKKLNVYLLLQIAQYWGSSHKIMCADDWYQPCESIE